MDRNRVTSCRDPWVKRVTRNRAQCVEGHTIRQLLQFEGATPVLRINKAWFEAAVPIGFALIVLRSAQGIARDLRDLRAGREVYIGKAMFEE